MIQRRNSTLLELEAADYFKLDPDQIDLMATNKSVAPASSRSLIYNANSIFDGPDLKLSSNSLPAPSLRKREATREFQKYQMSAQENKQSVRIIDQQRPNQAKRGKTTSKLQHSMKSHRGKSSQSSRFHSQDSKVVETNSSECLPTSARQRSLAVSLEPVNNQNYYRIGNFSPDPSTNSLPSVSSSPSLSPSLVCPHLSLDDILSGDCGRMSESPHTIGLCPKCRLDPPPDIQSPLSPMFRPSRSSILTLTRQENQVSASNPDLAPSPSSRRKTEANAIKGTRGLPATQMRRGYSDQTQTSAKIQRRLKLQQDDSIDYFLEPDVVKRLQLSPTLRNSVEFIRNNTTEAGRVIRIYKNGKPFDRPLRVSVMRGEFANLNHLLDHVNSRQLIPLGARYLFHLDGQLVYSVEELKHNSIYVVSGTRSFDFKTNNVLKEQLQRERTKTTNLRPNQRYQVTVNYSSRANSNDSLPEVGTSSKFLTDRASSIKPQRIVRKDSSPLRVTKKSTPTQTVKSREKEATYTRTKEVSSNTEPKSKIRTTTKQRQPSVTRKVPKYMASEGRKSSLSKSRDSLEKYTQSDNATNQFPIKPMTRAKSEMSALPNKPKKNVTFVDTGRGSSPAINITGRSPLPKPVVMIATTTEKCDSNQRSGKESETSEIGIQVSDSIEGFLIDLPIPLNTSDINSNNSSTTRSTAASRNRQRAGSKDDLTSRKNNSKAATTGGRKTKRRIVTITEHQLSFDELDTLKDMDHGDHHSEAHKPQKVSIKLNSGEDIVNLSGEKDCTKEEDAPQKDRDITMIDEAIMVNQEQAATESDIVGKESTSESNGNSQWQYPGGRPEQGGRQGSVTPTERPVSQSDANDVVRARVLTPSPSISTMGDSNSLAMSYEAAIVPNTTLRRQSTGDSGQGKQETGYSELGPQKQRVPVKGKPCLGIQMPKENFQLAWINGFAINDLYPDNSTVASLVASVSDPVFKQLTGESPTGSRRVMGTSPSTLASVDMSNSVNQFQPSERFNNWIWHSKSHDELVYPAGSIIVLWSHWSNEQRFYAKHTTSVSCLTLASLDTDLAASAQVQDPSGVLPNASIHLWSLSSLETLRVLDDNRFRGLNLYSLKVRNTESEGCELTVGGREDKRLWLFVCFLNLKLKQTNDESTAADVKKPKDGKSTEAFRVLKSSKPILNNQLPLTVMRLSNVKGDLDTQGASVGKSSQQQSLLGDVILSFGRRHFQLWFTNRRRSELISLQPSTKTTEYCELMIKATCMARITPDELVVGDSSGNIFLLLLDNVAGSLLEPSRTKDPKGKGPHKYDIDIVHLFSAQAANKQLAYVSTTCLSRVSGNLFASIDSTSALYFWRLERFGEQKTNVRCNQVCRIQLPPNLGFICSFILSRYSRKLPSVEFYLVSTSNAILYGSANLAPAQPGSSAASTSGQESNQPPSGCCTLSVIYEGHETLAMNLVADCVVATKQANKRRPANSGDENYYYFTCSLDFKICKWNGQALVWKSQLPSACASLAVHPIGFVLAIGSADGTVYILDKISGLLISYFPLTPVCINCLAYSSNGSLLAAGCSNGSIFILPVYESGLKYKKVSIFQSPHPVVSLQFSMDNKYILTSVTHGAYQELILWDLPNFRYMRENVTVAADRIQWFDSICSGSEDVRAIWENANLTSVASAAASVPVTTDEAKKTKLTPTKRNNQSKIRANLSQTVVNLSCHRLIRSSGENLAVASDTRGYIRLFSYTCSDIDQGFYESRISSTPVNCCRFLANQSDRDRETMFVSSSIDGSICLWKLTRE